MKKRYILPLIVMFSCCGCEVEHYKYYEESDYSVIVTNNTSPYVEVSSIKNVNVDWISGVVYFKESSEIDTIHIYEEFYNFKPTKNEFARYDIENDNLNIKFAKSNTTIFNDFDKDLYVVIPTSYQLESIYVNTMSSNVDIEKINVRNIKIAQVSGNNHIKAKAFNTTIETVSGNSLVELDSNDNYILNFKTTSGSFIKNSNVITNEEEYSYIGDYLSSIIYLYDVTTVSGNIEIKNHE